MNIYSLPAIISFTINFSIAFIVLIENSKVQLNRWFAAFIFSFAIWNLAEALILNSASLLPALFSAQILYRIIFIAPAFYVIIAYLFPKNFHKFATNLLFHIIVFSLPIIALVLSFPDFKIKLIVLKEAPQIYYYNFIFDFRPASLILFFISLSYIVWGNIVLVKKIRLLRTINLKNQTRFFVIGMIFIFVGFISVILLKTGNRNPASFYFLSTLLTLLVALFFLTSIIKFRMFKLGKFLRGGITYTILSTLTLAVYFFVIRAISESVELWMGINSLFFDAVLIVTLILIILPFEKHLQNLFDKLLNKDLQHYRKNILVLFRDLQSYYEKHDFFRIVTRFITDNFKSSKVYVFIYNNQSGSYIGLGEEGKIPSIPENSHIVGHINREKGPVEFYELNIREISKECRNFFENANARFLLPVIYENSMLAILVLCHKKYGLEYNENEKEIMSILGSEIAASFRRNQIIEEYREKDRRRFQVEKLAAIGQLSASVAHEIRNPLNTISTSAETLLCKDISDGDQDELKQFIIEEANRLNRILSDFLNLARIRPATCSEIDMENLFELLSIDLQDPDMPEIKISYEYDIAEEKFLSDPDLLFQALLNLGLNARDAIKERCCKVPEFTCAEGKIKYTVNSQKNLFVFSVIDNGTGIPAEARESLYDPFFTTKKNGTGLGLSIVYQIIEVLAGSIDFTSQPGNTCFTVHLPKTGTL